MTLKAPLTLADFVAPDFVCAIRKIGRLKRERKDIWFCTSCNTNKFQNGKPDCPVLALSRGEQERALTNEPA